MMPESVIGLEYAYEQVLARMVNYLRKGLSYPAAFGETQGAIQEEFRKLASGETVPPRLQILDNVVVEMWARWAFDAAIKCRDLGGDELAQRARFWEIMHRVTQPRLDCGQLRSDADAAVETHDRG